MTPIMFDRIVADIDKNVEGNSFSIRVGVLGEYEFEGPFEYLNKKKGNNLDAVIVLTVSDKAIYVPIERIIWVCHAE